MDYGTPASNFRDATAGASVMIAEINRSTGPVGGFPSLSRLSVYLSPREGAVSRGFSQGRVGNVSKNAVAYHPSSGDQSCHSKP